MVKRYRPSARKTGFQYSIGDACHLCNSLSVVRSQAFNTPLEMHVIEIATPEDPEYKCFQYSIGDADSATQSGISRYLTYLSILHWRYYPGITAFWLLALNLPFNTPLEMLGVLMFGFVGF